MAACAWWRLLLLLCCFVGLLLFCSLVGLLFCCFCRCCCCAVALLVAAGAAAGFWLGLLLSVLGRSVPAVLRSFQSRCGVDAQVVLCRRCHFLFPFKS